jgi:penicillin-binding protein 1A
MRQTLNESPRPDEAGSGPPRGRPVEVKEGRSLTAGLAFLNALRLDLAVLLRRLGRAFRSARQARKSRRQAALAQAALRQDALRQEALRQEALRLSRRPSRSIFRLVIGGLVKMIVVVVVLGSLATAGAMVWALYDLPAEKPVGGKSSLLLEAANGEMLGRAGPLKLADAARADFPDDLVNAVISIEDRRFYSHPGFDPEGVLRALQRNIAAGTIVEGGSTITQQLVKMRLLGHERTLPHKLREALVAIWLDMEVDKDEILKRYLNGVYLGNSAYGMSAAARLYFGKRLSELTLPEAAMLAGMIQSPSRNNPLQNLAGAQVRAALVIDAMRDNGAIDVNTAQNAKAHPAVLHLGQDTLPARSWFADWVAKDATKTFGSSSSMRLRTTLMPGLQKFAEQAIDDVLTREGAERRASQAALVAMRPDGAVVAMVGGRDYQANEFNRAVDAQRQPGSAFKLFVYFAALRKGLTPNNMIDARPLDIRGWHPENFENRRYGRMTLAEAFARSVNTAAARLAQQVGVQQVIAAARDLGVTDPLPAVPSLALGVADVNLLELTAAYAAVRAGKMPIKPWGVAAFGVDGQPPSQSMGAPDGGTQSLQPYQKPLLDLLQDVVRHGTGRAAALNGFAAGKTGTSQKYHDAWFIGFNDTLVTGVWVGNDDRTPMNRVTGGSLPAEIWKRFMTAAAATADQNTQPPPTADTSPNTSPNQDTAVGQAPTAQAAPHCDYRACGSAYHSFRASDCTYQPNSGEPRRLCDKNTSSPTAAATPTLNSSSLMDQLVSNAQCRVDVCARSYSSFDPADCTYKPFGGHRRRLCTK